MKNEAAAVERPLIKGYRPYIRDIEHDQAKNTADGRALWVEKTKNGGFNPLTKKWSPLHPQESYLSDVLDHITAACEAGIVEQYSWATQLFATPEAVDYFLNELELFDELWRITDRWWQALASLAEVRDEEDFVTSSEIAQVLRVAVAEGDGKLEKLRLMAEYLKENPIKPKKIAQWQRRALWARNTKLANKLLPNHFTRELPFHNEFCFVEGKMLHAREATSKDILSLERPKDESTQKEKSASLKKAA